MLIFLDLDGTITYTVHPGWKPYKDGQRDCPIADIPVFNGAKEFIVSRKGKGDTLVIVSDSHPRYVNPIAKMFGLEALSLADKPNAKKLNEFLEAHPLYKQMVVDGSSCIIGDTRLDIELGRRIGALTVWFLPYRIEEQIKDRRDGIGDDMASKKMGPTYAAKTFVEIDYILDSPLENLYSIEGTFADSISMRSIRFSYKRYMDGSCAWIRCLARQEQGECDKYAVADKYCMMSNTKRTSDFLRSLAQGISSYLNQPDIIQKGWDYFSYLTDKATTVPRYKMKEIFDLVDTPVQKIELLKWADNTEKSLRNKNLYNERKSFLEQYLSVVPPNETIVDSSGVEYEQPVSLSGKNIVILDDQLTTGATAWHVIKSLKCLGAHNVLFVAMFQMILPVNNENKLCPRCGKPMILKIRRSDGHRFYSCTPPKYNGDGCGYIAEIPNQ